LHILCIRTPAHAYLSLNLLHIPISFVIQGTKCFRVPYNTVLDTYASLVDAILQKYLPYDAKPYAADDYLIKVKDVRDASFPIDIGSTEDLDMAINSPFAKEQELKIRATIHLKSDPPVPDADVAPPAQAGGLDVIDMSSTVSPLSSSGEKANIVTPTKKTKTPPKKKRTKAKASTSRGSKQPVRARIIRSIKELTALGNPSPPRKQVALLAEYTCTKSKGFANALCELKGEGLIRYPDSKTVALTDIGLQSLEAQGVVPPANNAEVHARIKALLKPKQCEIFDLLAVGGQAYMYPRDEIGIAVGYNCPKSKGWTNSLSKMSSIGIIQYPKDPNNPKKKLLQLTEMCFPFLNQQANVQSVAADNHISSSITEVDDEALYNAPTPPLNLFDNSAFNEDRVNV